MIPDDKTTIITLTGHLGLIDQQAVESQFPSPESVERLVIDCTNVESMDSSIISLLMLYRRRFEAAGRDPLNIVLIVQPLLRRVFDMTGVSRALTVLPASEKTPDATT